MAGEREDETRADRLSSPAPGYAVTLSAKDAERVEEIVRKEDGRGALDFLIRSLWDPISRYEQGRCKCWFDGWSPAEDDMLPEGGAQTD